MKRNKFIILIAVIFLLAPMVLYAQSPSSTNYRLDSSDFNFGGGYSTSTNYGSTDALGGEMDTTANSSTSYNIFSGFFPRAYPGVPTAPNFTNTGGSLYNTLDFKINTGGNTSDVSFAIAISTDNFTTTNFVQADDTIGSSPVWQTYINWGGSSGQRLIYLTSSTTYYIKAKARYGPNSETGYSLVSSASTVAPVFSMVIQGVNSGTSIGSFTTNIGSQSTTVLFSTLPSGSIKVAAQLITITTNALAGYTTTLAQDHDLAKSNGTTIPAVSGTNASPAAWPVGLSTGAFGYHTMDSSLCTGTQNRFIVDNTFAAATSTSYEVICNTGPTNSESTNIVFKVEIEAGQPAGEYRNEITYVTTPQY